MKRNNTTVKDYATFIESDRQSVPKTINPVCGQMVQAIPTTTPELIQKVNNLSGNTSDLEIIVDALENRLQPIVRPLPGKECANDRVVSPPQAALSNEVENVADRLFYLRNRISVLLEALAI